MTYYLHRISHHAKLAYPLLERGILSIGWSDFATRDFVSSHQATGWEYVPEAVEQNPDYGKMRSRFCLQRFLRMNAGDRVVVPTWGAFHVYDIATDERLIAADLDLHDLKTQDGHRVRCEQDQLKQEEREGQWRRIDLGFFRKVKCVARGISRSDHADNKLSSRLRVRQTNVDIDDIRDRVDEAIARQKKGTSINLASEIKKECADKFLSLITEKLDPGQLEALIRGYFKRIGASSVCIPAKNERDKEGDADIVATFEPIKTIIYVQAKRHTGTTEAWAVEQINSYVKNKELGPGDDYTRIPWVISTASEFSPACVDKAKQHRVHLINGRELATRMLEAGMEGQVF